MNSGLVPLHESARQLARERAKPPTKVDLAAQRIAAGEAPQDVGQDLKIGGDELREAVLRADRPKSKLRPIRQPRVVRRAF